MGVVRCPTSRFASVVPAAAAPSAASIALRSMGSHRTFVLMFCYVTKRTVLVQAYFLKNPGNFGPLFLKTLHCAAPLSGMNQHYYHMERGPRRVFSRKNVRVTKSPFPPGNVTFFRRKNADFTARAVRFLEKNGGLVV